MYFWVCCNCCFLPPGADRKLALTTCGHIICSVCYQKGTQGKCLTCNAKCQVSPLSDKSSSEVKALFSDVNDVATKHLKEISKVIMFQARHQKRLLTHYQQRNEKLEDVLVKMKEEMQQMTKKLNEQSAYIAKLENRLQHQSVRASSVSQMSHSSHTPHGHKPVLQIPYNSPFCPSRHSSSTIVTEDMEVDERSLFRKSKTVPRLSLISPPQDERMGSVSHRSSNQNTLANHSARSATVSRFQGTPVFRPLSSFRHSMSSLVCGSQLPLIGIYRMRKGRSGEPFMVSDSIHLSASFHSEKAVAGRKALWTASPHHQPQLLLTQAHRNLLHGFTPFKPANRTLDPSASEQKVLQGLNV